jgi:hypothetical protein
MKINILDSGIIQRLGHHYDYCLKLARYYSAAGMDVHVYGGVEMDEETEAEFAKVGSISKLFRLRPYQEPDAYDHYGGEIHQHHVEAQSVAEDLKGARPADLWIWPSLAAHEVQACAQHRIEGRIVGCVHADPGVEYRSAEARLWRSSLLSAEASGLRLTLSSYELELRHRFAPIFPASSFVIIPHPVEGPAPAEPKEQLKRIGFIGHQRPNKESPAKVGLLTKLIEDGFAVTYQNSSREEPPAVPGVDILGYVDDLAVPIAECDLVVLPYDVEFYFARGSGILAQCLALGVPTVAPYGTLPGRTIERFGVGPLSVGNSGSAIYGAIKAAARGYSAYATNAQRTARAFCRRNGVAKFAEAYLAAGDKPLSKRSNQTL